ncbi:MAG: hypothetical protein VB104_07020 [Candidatus Limiplasma sp.]|nr:hypothetical protein [Candidatus Limiplasma sp.]
MLTQKEKYLLLAEEHHLTVYDSLPPDFPLNGLYLEDETHRIILMKASLPDRVYTPVLVEEIGHYATSFGVVVELDGVTEIKSENKAHEWAIEMLLPICKFAFASCLFQCSTVADYADHFNLDEGFVEEAIRYHQRKGNWMESFDPIFQMLVKPNYRELLRKNKLAI